MHHEYFLRSSMCFRVPHLCSKIPKINNWAGEFATVIWSLHCFTVSFRGDVRGESGNKSTLLTISRLWRYCGPSNYRFNFLLYWYAPWVFFEVANVLSCSPFMFENAENEQLDWRIRHSHLASTLFHSLVRWWRPRRIRPQMVSWEQDTAGVVTTDWLADMHSKHTHNRLWSFVTANSWLHTRPDDIN